MPLRLEVKPLDGVIAKVKERAKPIATAATKAIAAAAAAGEAEGRAALGAAGMGKTYSGGWHGVPYPDPERAVSINAAALFVHKIPFANVFEYGLRIAPGKLMWVPFSWTPRKIGARRLDPETYVKEVGPLFSIKRGSRPILAGKMRVNDAFDRDVTLNKLRQGNGADLSVIGRKVADLTSEERKKRRRLLKGGAIASVVTTDSRVVMQPLFYGIDTVQMPKKHNLLGIVARVAASLPGLYYAAFTDDEGA